MDKHLIDKYFKGECTPQEAADFLKWMQGNNADPELTAYLAEYWEKMDDDLENESTSLRKIHQLIDQKEQKSPGVIGNASFYLKLAASVSIFLLVVWSFFQLLEPVPEVAIIEEVPSKFITKSTEFGQKLTVIMPDSSVVILNSGSSISYPRQFGDSLRAVNLTGEAFFDIRKNVVPFVVKSGDLETRVLGTTFNVKYQEQDQKIEVALLSGSVNVDREPGKNILLTPGDLVVYDLQEEKFSRKKWDYKKNFGWKEGILYFENDTFDKIKHQLEKWYGVEIEMNKTPGSDRHYSGSFQNASLRNVLESISFTFRFRYKLEDRFVSITF